MKTQIKTWGNSQGVRIPKEVLSEAGFLPDETVAISVERGRIILHKEFRHRSLKERAAEFGGNLGLSDEIDFGAPAEGEIW